LPQAQKNPVKSRKIKNGLVVSACPLDRQPKATLHGSTLGDNAASSSH
jgi:hypothetical protein